MTWCIYVTVRCPGSCTNKSKIKFKNAGISGHILPHSTDRAGSHLRLYYQRTVCAGDVVPRAAAEGASQGRAVPPRGSSCLRSLCWREGGTGEGPACSTCASTTCWWPYESVISKIIQMRARLVLPLKF